MLRSQRAPSKSNAISFSCQALGVLGAAVAIAPGFFDFVALPQSHPAVDTATFHRLAISGAWLMFIASLALRGAPATAAPPIVATAAAVSGFVFMAIGGWLGSACLSLWRGRQLDATVDRHLH